MSNRVDQILLSYFENIDAPPRSPETVWAAARRAMGTLMGTYAEGVYFYRRSSFGWYRMAYGLPDTGYSVPKRPPSGDVLSDEEKEKLACKAKNACGPICVYKSGSNASERWLFPLEEWGFVFCDTPCTPDQESLQGACQVANSVAGHGNDFLLQEEADRKARQEMSAAAILSHEFRSPLTVAVSALDLLKKKMKIEGLYTQGDDIEKYLDFLQTNLRKIQRLTTNLLDCSGLENYQCKRENVDIPSLLHEMAKDVLAYAQESGVKFSCETDEDNMPYACDPFCLERIVLNLLTNAIQHTPRDGCVLMRQKRDLLNIHIDVENDGDAISENDRAHLFEKFWRGSGKRKRGGAGLGLYISQCFAQKLGGHISVENREQGGVRFMLELPIQTTSANVVESAPSAYHSHRRELLQTELSVLLDETD